MLVTGANDAGTSRDGLSHKRLTTPSRRRAVGLGPMRYPPWILVAVPLVTISHPASAQCDGKIVSGVSIVPRDPSFIRFPRSLRPVARALGLHHTTTKADVIRNFLLLTVGQPCTERLRTESERILRFQPFLADATVRAVSDTAGGVRIEVETIDEIPTIFSLRVRNGSPTALRIGNGNVDGRGIYLAVRGQRGFAYRNGVGMQLVAQQVFDRPYTLALVVDRTPLGSTVSAALGHVFITDLQRSAWHVGFRDVHDYTSFLRPDGQSIALGARRRFADYGGVVRIGLAGRSAFVGGLVTHELVTPAAQAVIVSDSGFVADTSTPLTGPFALARNMRLNAVVGVRSVAFRAVRGFDALAGAQDVATGIQFGAIGGPRGSWVGGARNHSFLFSPFFAAGDAPFGVDSRLKVGMGLGLLAAIPPQSRQLWRLDVAVPVSADAHAHWEIRLTATRARDFWREPRDVARARAGAAPSTIFTWP